MGIEWARQLATDTPSDVERFDGYLEYLDDDDTERSKREVEAEVVAYAVGRYCVFDTSGLAFYLVAWEA